MNVKNPQHWTALIGNISLNLLTFGPLVLVFFDRHQTELIYRDITISALTIFVRIGLRHSQSARKA
jgi:hypothetical protein